MRLVAALVVVAGVLMLRVTAAPVIASQSDLDAFMQAVLTRRDDNWKQLQQYILDEREQMELRGPASVRLWGERREYTWYIRDGFFVRSPVKFNGVTIGETDRRKYEADYLKRVRARERREVDRPGAPDPTDPNGTSAAPEDVPEDVAGLIQQSRRPEFISSAYLMRFKFDAGNYALAGREQFEGREVLRIEYYPTKLFADARDRRGGRAGRSDARNEDALLARLLNKVALVTMWIEPESHQIVKSTFDNVTFDFLPGQWLVRVEDVKASMTMGQAFPDVWLPRDVNVNVAMALAIGPVDFKYALSYHDYRRAEATIRIR